MKLVKIILGIAVLTIALSSGIAHAGVPFTNIEGVGGVALNPRSLIRPQTPAEPTHRPSASQGLESGTSTSRQAA